jgi:hypothetical protein
LKLGGSIANEKSGNPITTVPIIKRANTASDIKTGLPDLLAEAHEVAIESVTIVHEGLVLVDEK